MICAIQILANGIKMGGASPVGLARVVRLRVDWRRPARAGCGRTRRGLRARRLAAGSARLPFRTGNGDCRIDRFDLARERAAIACERAWILRMKLSPPAHGDAECGDGGDEDQRAAFTGSGHAHKVRARSARSVTNSTRLQLHHR
jgi:hypothetical protein